MLTDEQLAAIRQRAERAHTEVAAICTGERRWTMSIPARKDSDSDLVISAALNDVDLLLADNERLRTALDAALPVLGYVSAGRSYVDVERYPDATARRVAALAHDALGDTNAAH